MKRPPMWLEDVCALVVGASVGVALAVRFLT